jgi:hypothetical protein
MKLSENTWKVWCEQLGSLDWFIWLEVGRVLSFHSESIAEILGHLSLLCGGFLSLWDRER